MTANDRQVGGSHYSGTYQHWDYVLDVRMGYHAGNASAYVARWRKKNGLEDLEKAIHYMDKCAECVKPRDFNKLEMVGAQVAHERFSQSNDLGHLESIIIWHMVLGEWSSAKAKIRVLLEDPILIRSGQQSKGQSPSGT